MRISFDIDDTLVCRNPTTGYESGLLPSWILHELTEPLRQGSRTLIRELRQKGCSVWIYTSSFRSPLHIWFWLRLHGIQVDGIVNDDRHRLELSRRNFAIPLSKYPPAFGINLHIDDSEGVRIEGQTHGFNVLVVSPNDENWVEKVLAASTQSQ